MYIIVYRGACGTLGLGVLLRLLGFELWPFPQGDRMDRAVAAHRTGADVTSRLMMRCLADRVEDGRAAAPGRRRPVRTLADWEASSMYPRATTRMAAQPWRLAGPHGNPLDVEAATSS